MGIGVWAVAMALAGGVQSVAASAGSDPVDLDAFVERARDADVVVLGELHDNPAHHAVQAEVVAALQPEALVFEMIPQEREDDVNALRRQGASRAELAESLDWETSGWPDFSYYASILEAAPEAQVFGGGQPMADVRRAMVEGAAGPFGPDAAVYGLDRALEPEEQAAREAIQAQAHCGALPPEMLPGMVEAQRLRDAGLADAALWARASTEDGQVVVITGNGHADKTRGVPAAIALADPDVEVLSLGQGEDTDGEDTEGAGAGAADLGSSFDYYMTSPPVPREDACLSLLQPT
jgi:uncharacterized iron-regulated protein